MSNEIFEAAWQAYRQSKEFNPANNRRLNAHKRECFEFYKTIVEAMNGVVNEELSEAQWRLKGMEEGE